MPNISNYLLSIDPNGFYDIDKLKNKLDLCVNWARLFACAYLLHTTSSKEKLYSRFKEALPNNKFFIIKVNLAQEEYTGWLGESRWGKIKEFKNKI